MDNNILLFHIGIPKTATSAIQTFLRENKEILLQYGWDYPDLFDELGIERPFPDGNEKKNGTVFFQKDGNIDYESEKWDNIWRQLRIHLKKANVIVSAEELSFFVNTKRFLEEAKKQYSNLKVVVYLRRQDEFVESWWKQVVKSTTSESRTLKEYYIEEESCHKFDNYFEYLEGISSVIGNSNVKPLIFDKKKFNASSSEIAWEFLDILNIRYDKSEFKPVTLINESLNTDLLEIKRNINPIIGSQNVTQPWKYAESIIKINGMKYEDSSTVREDEIYVGDIIRNSCRYNNKRVAQKFFGLEEDLFSYSDIITNKSGLSDKEKDIVRIFAQMLVDRSEYLQKQIWDLEYTNRHLITYIVTTAKGERKVAFFGAGKRCKIFCSKYKIKAELIIDNDEKKWGETIEGMTICGLKDVKNINDYYYVITVVDNSEIKNQLNNMGLQEHKDYICL